MEFNEYWTKEINDEYRQMIKEHKSVDEIRERFKDVLGYHPNDKFKYHRILSYERFSLIGEEIKFNPNYTYFEWNYIQSPRYSNEEDIIFFFEVNEIKYILLLEIFINENFGKYYNIFFTTQKQYDDYLSKTSSFENPNDYDKNFKELQDIVEKETNFGDIIKIFNSISYILLKYSKNKQGLIFTIFSDSEKKMNFYHKSITDSFQDKCDVIMVNDQYFYIVKQK